MTRTSPQFPQPTPKKSRKIPLFPERIFAVEIVFFFVLVLVAVFAFVRAAVVALGAVVIVYGIEIMHMHRPLPPFRKISTFLLVFRK